jgi:hypothetical protein
MAYGFRLNSYNLTNENNEEPGVEIDSPSWHLCRDLECFPFEMETGWSCNVLGTYFSPEHDFFLFSSRSLLAWLYYLIL